jgi:predicted RecB family nuclease
LELHQLTVRGGFGPMAEMLMAKGLEHEQACLDHYQAQDKSVFAVPVRESTDSFADWTARIGNPMAASYDVIYQMPFVHEGVRGVADFVERVVDAATGAVRWEPVDAKLARASAKPGHVLQLCFYAGAIEAITGVAPVDLRIWLGSGKVQTVRLDDVSAYWRRLRTQLVRVMDADATIDTKAEKCAHCEFCEFAEVCVADWRAEDSLIFVANISQTDRSVLVADGLPTMTLLAERADAVPGLRPERQERLVTQAALQIEAALDPELLPPIVLLPADANGEQVGFLAMPEPDDGDVFLDYEGHPFWHADAGLFFLFGLLTRGPDGAWVYEACWAHDEVEEGAATKALIEYFVERRGHHAGMHVYHYNHTERSSLERLAEQHGVGQTALATLVTTGLFVDLLTTVTNAMLVGVESYGLKHIERLTGYERGHDIEAGAGAVVEYDAWCHDHDATRLDRIARYNEDDVQATMALRDWLLTQRPVDLPWRAAFIEPGETTYPDIDAQVEALHAFALDSTEHLLGDLLGYWLREDRAMFGGLVAKTQYELSAQMDDLDMLAGLRFVEHLERLGRNGKPITPAILMQVPPQRTGRKLAPGTSVVFRGGDEVIGFSSIASVDVEAGQVELIWNKRCQELGVLPTSIVISEWVNPKPKPATLSALATKVIAADEANEPSGVAMAILRREVPRFVDGGGPAGGVFTDDLGEMKRWVHELDHSYVAIQGPPGTGKTYSGAHLIHSLVSSGKRVGITAMSHHAIDNLLAEVLKVFTGAGDLGLLHVVRKVTTKPTKKLPSIEYTTDNDNCLKPEFNVVAGTTWLFAREDMHAAPLDVLIIDEAGQLSLADTLAAAGAADNVILLGDPLQLANVTQGAHPSSSGASVLQHVLGGDATIPVDRGVFLSETRRMHPDVCRFISEQIYDGRLTSYANCAVQNTGAGTGLRWLRATHANCSTESEVEAEIVVSAIADLIDQDWTDINGSTRPLGVGDFMVVAPYNDQVQLLQRSLAANPLTAGAHVGTVDKFQGQEAPVVFFTMTASRSADVARGIGFLFSKNRLNVAISRARALAYLVCTDELLDTRAKTVEDMELVAALCAFVEYAESAATQISRGR